MADPAVRDLAEAAMRLAGARVLVVGDVMLDRFVHGEVARISPEAPIPVFRVTGETAMPGGAGNVARNAAALGAAVTLVGVIGDDDEGRALAAMLANEASITARLVADSARPTTTKTRHVAGGQQLLRADRESTAPIGAATADEIVAAVGSALARTDVLVLSDYAKGVLTDDVLARLIAAAAGKPVVVDPKARDLRRYAGATVLTPNRAELATSAGLALDDDASIAEAAQGALATASAGALLVTRGSEGMTLVTRAGTVEHLPTAAREVYDVAGAGDTVTAVLGAALGVGLPLATAARLANLAAGIVVGKRGTAVVHPDELAHALRERALLDAESKVVGLATAQGIVEAWRRGGQRVAFTNGCFDLLHPGHISLLNQAKAVGDRLVVGLNADAGVTRLKGAGRPVQSDVARAQVLASLAVVDLVVVFGEDTPIKLIDALRPDVLVKGADYRLDQVVGAGQVARWGGRVVLADLTPGYSTTETIKRLGR